MDVSKFLTRYQSNSSIKIAISSIETPLGLVLAAADDDYLHMLMMEDSKNLEKKFESLQGQLSCSFVENKKNKVLNQLEQQLSDYFCGKIKNFTVPIKTFGSAFQMEVWKKLQEISYGSTLTYGELAKAMGKSGGARAVGAACGANAHLIIIPCHRLVASGSKGGFSCGLDRKEMLLLHENKHST